MESFMKTVQTNIIVQASLFIVLGLVLLLMPDTALVTVVYLIAIVFAISAAVSLVAYFRQSSPSYHMQGALITGIFLAVIALIMFCFPFAVAGIVSILLGAVLILCGIANAVRSVTLRAVGGPIWIVGLVVGILVAFGGVLIIWNPFETTVVLVMVLGVLLVCNGASSLVIELSARKERK